MSFLTDKRRANLARFSFNVAQLFLATLVISVIIGGKFVFATFTIGVVLTILSGIIGLWLEK